MRTRTATIESNGRELSLSSTLVTESGADIVTTISERGETVAEDRVTLPVGPDDASLRKENALLRQLDAQHLRSVHAFVSRELSDPVSARVDVAPRPGILAAFDLTKPPSMDQLARVGVPFTWLDALRAAEPLAAQTSAALRLGLTDLVMFASESFSGAVLVRGTKRVACLFDPEIVSDERVIRACLEEAL